MPLPKHELDKGSNYMHAIVDQEKIMKPQPLHKELQATKKRWEGEK